MAGLFAKGVGPTALAVLALLAAHLEACENVSAHTSSPDPRCRVNLTATAHLWTRALPLIEDAAQLNRSGWWPYLTALYGDLEEPGDFPIDVRCFTLFYPNLLPAWVSSLLRTNMRSGRRGWRHKHTRNGEVLLIGTKRLVWQVYLLGSPFEASAVPYGGKASADERVEIWHDFDDCRHAGPDAIDKGARIGFWGHFAPGSGIFARLGKTLVTGQGGYGEACTRFVADPETSCAGCCRPVHERVYAAVSRLGYDSMQSCCGYRGGDWSTRAFEITLFSGKCGARPHSRGGCPVSAQQRPRPGGAPRMPWLSRGRGRPRRCACADNSTEVINCGAVAD